MVRPPGLAGRTKPSRLSCDRQRGMVTAELAVSILTVLVVSVTLSWGVFLLVMQLRCLDTAAQVARQAARGDTAAVRQAKAQAPAGSRVTVSTAGSVTRVEVELTARPLAEWLVSVPLRAHAEVATEPGVEG